MLTGLDKKKYRTIDPSEGPLSFEACELYLREVPGWILIDKGRFLMRYFEFNNYYETMAFVNALAYIAHQSDHHPHLEVDYNRCLVRYDTHTVKGLSENDFIAAAQINALS